MPKVTIDGREIEAEAGTTILQAALSQGAEVPHYCYHPSLSIAGNCRMCLVDVEKAPKLVIACATPIADGMVVNTRNDRVKQAQSSVMEFLLVNHPLDCPICDQAGECRLQEYSAQYGRGESRLKDEKLLQNKAVDIGEHVMLDQERCIQCSRCTRFCDEITETGELAFFQRGSHNIIGIQSGQRLDNPYSGNVVDLCPVGALTLKEFRFQNRVWYLKNTPSICAGCARGCNVMVAVGRQQELMTTRGQMDDRIKRLVPRPNAEVNDHWICDEGRLSHQRLDAAPRLATAQAPAGTELDWDEAVRRAATALKEAGEAGRAGAIFSPRMVTESIYAWTKLFSEFGLFQLGVRRLERGEDDNLLIRKDRGANSLGARWVLGEGAEEQTVLDAAQGGALDALVVFGDPLDPDDTAVIDAGARAQLKHLIYVGPFLEAAAEAASLLLPGAAWAEEDGSLVNFEGRVQWARRAHLPRGEGRPGWRIVADMAEAAGVEMPEWGSAGDVLESMASEVESFSGMTVSGVGLLGAPGAAGAAV
jgi:NADH-quinone oxidoreductase subunit G